MTDFRVPLLVRGRLIEQDWVAFGARGRGTFAAVDVARHVEALPMGDPGELSDLAAVPFDEIVEVLAAVGAALRFDANPHVQEALEASLVAAEYPASMLENSYIALPGVFRPEAVREMAERRIGVEYLDGWAAHDLSDGRQVRIRAFGSRQLHIPAGNGGLVSAITIIRAAITRSDAIIKAPSNDPLTAMAIVRTFNDVAPDHPLTRHLSVAYWKGGDDRVESRLLRPENIEKVVAWGGMASVQNVVQYIRPGLELIALDPKRSATIIGREAFDDDSTIDDVAVRAATDIGVANQEACASARVMYVESGTDAAGLARAERLARRIYEELLDLPDHLSTPARWTDRDLIDHVEATRLEGDWYTVIGATRGEGGVIVSRLPEPVDYSAQLSGRIANVVPVDSASEAIKGINAYTQTVGIYPESLKRRLRDVLPLYGAQRLTSLGYACHVNAAIPQDAIEPVRRMCKWIVDEQCDRDKVVPMWEVPRLRELIEARSL